MGLIIPSLSMYASASRLCSLFVLLPGPKSGSENINRPAAGPFEAALPAISASNAATLEDLGGATGIGAAGLIVSVEELEGKSLDSMSFSLPVVEGIVAPRGGCWCWAVMDNEGEEVADEPAKGVAEGGISRIGGSFFSGSGDWRCSNSSTEDRRRLSKDSVGFYYARAKQRAVHVSQTVNFFRRLKNYAGDQKQWMDIMYNFEEQKKGKTQKG